MLMTTDWVMRSLTFVTEHRFILFSKTPDLPPLLLLTQYAGANDIPPVLFLFPIICILLRLHFVTRSRVTDSLPPAPINLIKLLPSNSSLARDLSRVVKGSEGRE